jgi:elongation factor Ts
MNKEDLQKLRDETGAGVMDCKKALEEANGDMEKAKEIIKEKGMIIASKKSERKTGAGFLKTYIHNDRVGVLMEIRAETDFAIKSDPFQTMAHELAMQVAAMGPEDVNELLEQPFIKDASKKVEDIVTETIAEVGENINIERFARYKV